MNKFLTLRNGCAALLAAGLITGCANLTTPKSVNGSSAYAGGTLQAVEQTAAAEYPSMPSRQVKAVHGYIKQAEQYRDQALSAIQSGNTNVAQTKLQKLASLMTTINAALQKTANGSK